MITPTIEGIRTVKNAFQFEKRCASATTPTVITIDQMLVTAVISIDGQKIQGADSM